MTMSALVEILGLALASLMPAPVTFASVRTAAIWRMNPVAA